MGNANRFDANKALLFLLISVFLVNLALGIQQTAYNNFVNDIIGIDPAELGFVQSVREIPGLFTVVLIGAVSILSQSLIFGFCAILLGAGLILHGTVTTVPQLVLAIVIISIGFHMIYPVQAAMTLAAAKAGEKGRRMGQFQGAQAGAFVTGTVLVYLLANVLSGAGYYRFLYWTAGLLAMAAGANMLLTRGFQRPPPAHKVPRFLFRPEYRSFYILRLISASQRHMFVTFAVFLLVHTYGIHVQQVAILMGVSNGLAIYIRPMIGRLVDAWGTQKTITAGYTVATATALTYAFVPVLPLLYVAYCIDNWMMGMDMAISVHLDEIARPQDLAPTLALGGTLNHILGIIIPFVGGIIWQVFSFQYTFILGALISAFSIYLVQRFPQAPVPAAVRLPVSSPRPGANSD